MGRQLIGVNRRVQVELNDRGRMRTGATESSLALLGIVAEVGSTDPAGWAGPRDQQYLVLGEGLAQPQLVGPGEVSDMKALD